jgi:hypothetical protein
MLTINVQDSAHYVDRVTIDGTQYLFTFDYYSRLESWYLSIADSEESPIATGRKLSPGWNPLVRDKDSRLPKGKFYLSSTTDPVGREGFNDGSASLKYFSAEEAAEFAAEAETSAVTVEVTS